MDSRLRYSLLKLFFATNPEGITKDDNNLILPYNIILELNLPADIMSDSKICYTIHSIWYCLKTLGDYNNYKSACSDHGLDLMGKEDFLYVKEDLPLYYFMLNNTYCKVLSKSREDNLLTIADRRRPEIICQFEEIRQFSVIYQQLILLRELQRLIGNKNTYFHLEKSKTFLRLENFYLKMINWYNNDNDKVYKRLVTVILHFGYYLCDV